MSQPVMPTVWSQAPELRGHLCYLAYAGSRSYGTSSAASDVDLRGIAFAPVEAMFGLQSYEQTILSEPDLVVYALNKYIRLAVKGNPNIVEMLYVELQHVVYSTAPGDELRAHRELFSVRAAGSLLRRVRHSPRAQAGPCEGVV